MIWSLRILYLCVLAAMLGVTSFASLHTPLWLLPKEIWQHPWFVATLFDAYFGFLAFYLWVAYKETGILARLTWFVAIMLLGNIAMAIYMLIQLFLVGPEAPVESILLRSKKK